MAFWIMPTCGPLPWAITTSSPSWIRSTMAFAVFFTAAICSGRFLPRAFPPRAITILCFINSHLTFFSGLSQASPPKTTDSPRRQKTRLPHPHPPPDSAGSRSSKTRLFHRIHRRNPQTARRQRCPESPDTAALPQSSFTGASAAYSPLQAPSEASAGSSPWPGKSWPR